MGIGGCVLFTRKKTGASPQQYIHVVALFLLAQCRMRWTPGGRDDIEDMRGRSGGFGVAHLGIGGFLVLLVLSWASGTNLFSLLGTGDTSPSQSVGTSGELRTTPSEERMADFVNAVSKDAQDTWAGILGARYERTHVVLFRDAIE